MPSRADSTAFERLVRDPAGQDGDDVVGLLAYAYYERDKRDLAASDELSDEQLREHHRILTPGLVEQYRENALRRLESYARTVVASVEPEIRESTRTDALVAAKNDIIAQIRASTSWRLTISLNVLAWLISLAITFLVAVGFGKISIGISPG